MAGWRIVRRYRWKGSLAFLGAWSLWGFFLDNAGSNLFSGSRLMVIGTGVIPRMADFLVYATCMASVLVAIRIVGGPFQTDRLARTGKLSAVS